MKLKIEGKLRDGFFEWIWNNYNLMKARKEPQEYDRTFEELPQSAQFGLLQEYADTLEYKIGIDPYFDEYDATLYRCDGSIFRIVFADRFNLRPEAQAAAIAQLNKIINDD